MALLPGDLSFGGGALGTLKNILIGFAIFVVAVGGASFFVWKRKQNKMFNIPLEIVTPRSDGVVVEWNKGLGGYFKSKKVGGITSFRVKRKGMVIVDIPPPASSFLIAPNRTLLLAQKGVDDYEPILPSNLSYVQTPDGKLVPILKLKAINQDATAWACDNEETAKKRFTFASLWEKYQLLISLMLFIFILFLVMYITWIGLKDVALELANVAENLKTISIPTTNAPIITPTP